MLEQSRAILEDTYIITQFSVERQLFQPCRPYLFLCYLGSILGAMTGIRFVDIAPWPKSVLLYVPFMASVRKSKLYSKCRGRPSWTALADSSSFILTSKGYFTSKAPPCLYLGSTSLSLHPETISVDNTTPYIIIFSIEVHIVIFPTCNCLTKHLPSAIITSVPSHSLLWAHVSP